MVGGGDPELDDISRAFGDKRRIALMNPPFTTWKDIGSKFEKGVQDSIRARLRSIWSEAAHWEPILDKTPSSSIGPLFECLALNAVRQEDGVVGMVLPTAFMLGPSQKTMRQLVAERIHVNYVLSCHEPSNTNMSWNTAINECLLVASYDNNNQSLPTKFISIDRMPSTLDEAHEVITRALLGKNFDGSVVNWPYDRMVNGDWYPVAFRNGQLAELLDSVLDSNYLNTGLGGGWKAGRLDI